MARLKIVKQPMNKQYVRELIQRYMNMSRDKLIAMAQKPDLPVLEFSICNLLVKCIPTGDFSKLNEFVDETIARLEVIAPDDQADMSNMAAPDEMDFTALKRDLTKSVFVSTKLMADQALHEYSRVGKLRGTIEKIEERLFAQDTLKRLPEHTLAKVYNSASTNLNNSINYIRSVNGNLTQQLDVISQIEAMQHSPLAPTDDTSATNPAMARIRELIARKIRERSGSINAVSDESTQTG